MMFWNGNWAWAWLMIPMMLAMWAAIAWSYFLGCEPTAIGIARRSISSMSGLPAARSLSRSTAPGATNWSVAPRCEPPVMLTRPSGSARVAVTVAANSRRRARQSVDRAGGEERVEGVLIRGHPQLSVVLGDVERRTKGAVNAAEEMR